MYRLTRDEEKKVMAGRTNCKRSGVVPPCSLVDFVGAYFFFVAFHMVFLVGGFRILYELVSHWPVRKINHSRENTYALGTLVPILDKAAIFYPTQIKCLHFAAASVCFLRTHGLRAELVIGVRNRPFRAHAWAEVEDKVTLGVVDRKRYVIIDSI